MTSEDYNKEILREKGYVVELSNQGGLKKHNPNFFNPLKKQEKCVSPDCQKLTKSVYGTCSKHKRLKDYPLHDKDWMGIVIIPKKTREECKTWALPHGLIAELLVRWISSDEEKGAKIDKFLDEIILKLHRKMPDATTLQKIHMGQKINGAISPDEFVSITKSLVNKHFPESEYKDNLINGNDKNFKEINVGNIPLRVVLASFVLALGCEESNRGDAWGANLNGVEPRYANMFMPMGGYLLRRKGATESEAKMSMRG